MIRSTVSLYCKEKPFLKRAFSVRSENYTADLFEIKTKGIYPNAYKTIIKQTKKEIETARYPKLLNKVEDIDRYNVVFIGTSNW